MPESSFDVDAFGVALNPMVESEWMFGRNVFFISCDSHVSPQHLSGRVFWFVFYFITERRNYCNIKLCHVLVYLQGDMFVG